MNLLRGYFLGCLLVQLLVVHNAFPQVTFYNDGKALTNLSGVTLTMNGNFVNQTRSGTDGSINNQGTITITGDWTNNATGGGQVFSTAAGTVQLIGTANTQTIGGTASTSFYNLTVNNTFSTEPQIILSRGQAVRNTLTMTAGKVDLGSNDLTLGISAALPGSLSHGGTTANG
jgi:hypothetical protein